ncbi:MAG: AMP-binding protein, partial [Blastocatellia bacterium]
MNLVEFIFKESNKLASGSKTAILFHDDEISYDMLYSQVRRAAGMFRSAGIKSGERVAIVLGDGPDFIVSFVGCVAAGAVAVPVNTMLPGDVLGYILNNCGANSIVTGADQIEKLTSAQANLNSLRNIWISGPDGTNQYEFESGESTPRLEGFQAAAQGAEETDIVGAADESLAFILYTSGSTGPPKGAMHLHRSIPLMVETACRQVLAIGAEDRLFSSSRLFFAYGLGNGLYFPLSSGATSILSDSKPDPVAIGGVLKRYRPTIFFGVPAIYKSLCRYIIDGNP